MVNDIRIQNEKKQIGQSLKAMSYSMNVFNERNVCGSFSIKQHYNHKLNHKLSSNHTI